MRKQEVKSRDQRRETSPQGSAVPATRWDRGGQLSSPGFQGARQAPTPGAACRQLSKSGLKLGLGT